MVRLSNFITTFGFVEEYESVLQSIASFAFLTLEFIGIVIIFFGAIKAIVISIMRVFKKCTDHNIKIDLANALALGLEFKMGSEIIKTALVRDLKELAVLAIIIVLRSILAVLIHWEIKVERKDAEALSIIKNQACPLDLKDEKEEEKVSE